MATHATVLACSPFAVPASMTRAVTAVHGGATTATLVYEGFSSSLPDSVPPPDPPHPSTDWRASQARRDRIIRPVPTDRHPMTLDDEVHQVTMLFA